MKHLYGLICLCALAIPLSASAEKNHPDCTGEGRWPAAMTLVYLKDRAPDRQAIEDVIDYNKVKVRRLSSIKIGVEKTISKYHRGGYRQIHHITYYKKTGDVLFEAITDGVSSHSECSGDLKVYQISRTFVS